MAVEDGKGTSAVASKMLTIRKTDNGPPTGSHGAEGSMLTVVVDDIDNYDNNPNTITYQWQSRLSGAQWTDIDNSNMPSYAVPLVEVDTDYRVVVSYIDDQGFSVTTQVAVFNYEAIKTNITVAENDIEDGNDIAYEGSRITLGASSAGGNGSYVYAWRQTGGDSLSLSGEDNPFLEF